MTSTRDILGEIEGKKIINRGDKVKVTYFDNNEKKEIEGIIISISSKEIEINGTTPKTKILVDKISSISKI